MKVAREHSANMAKQGNYEHVIDGKNPHDRTKAAGYKGACAENIACQGPNVPELMKDWMSSPVHRENILNPKMEEIGVGMVLNPKVRTEFYFTQVFGKSKGKK
jgi:uncharacterized protein YkwD